jgi:hypothetical protein
VEKCDGERGHTSVGVVAAAWCAIVRRHGAGADSEVRPAILAVWQSAPSGTQAGACAFAQVKFAFMQNPRHVVASRIDCREQSMHYRYEE